MDVIPNPDINTNHLIVEGQTLGTNDNILTDISLSPNPTSTILNISYNGSLNGASVSVHDVMGRNVLTETLKNNSLNVSTLKTGLYFLNLTVNGKSSQLKFIKK